MTERYHRRDFGDLEIQNTVDNPGAYVKPWTVNRVSTLETQMEMTEYVCNENNVAPVHAQPRPDFSGVWVLSGDTRLPGELAYQPWAKKLYEERKAAGAQDDPDKFCLPNGAVRVTSLPYKILQTPTLLVLLSEGNTHSYRRFFLDGRSHPKDEDPSWTGHSTGTWEGDTLVVDTVNFNDRTWLDSTGKPHSEAPHVIERYRRPDLEHMEVQYVLEDAKAFAKPYQFTRTFKLAPNREIQEYFCTDRNIVAGK